MYEVTFIAGWRIETEIVNSIEENERRYIFKGIYNINGKSVPFRRTMPKNSVLNIMKVGE